MAESENPAVEEIVARFFERGAQGRQESADDVPAEATGPAETKPVALSRTAGDVRSRWQRGSQGTESGLDLGSELPELPGYDLIECIGRGGMGAVYEAYQQATGRRVAIKFMHPPIAHFEQSRRRFEREVELIARLNHPNIVSVVDSGMAGERPFFVMEYVDGRPLDEFLIPGESDVAETLALIERICRAADYAHQRGVLHRDLKPSNILADHQGEPHLLDFGLAKAIESNAADAPPTLSEPGQLLGTLDYMSPEQSRGRFDELSVRSDVYSLGAIAYELITGRLPCDPRGPLAEVLDRIGHRLPDHPSVHRRGVPADVDAILLKALAKESPARYATAGDFAEDLRRYLSGEVVSARHVGSAARLVRWANRNRSMVAVAAAALLAVAMVGSAALVQILRERDRALEAEQSATQKAEQAEAAAAYLASVYRLFDPYVAGGGDRWSRQVLQQSLDRIDALDDQPLGQAMLLESIGMAWKHIGDFPRARESLERALSIRQQELGADSLEVGQTLNALGEVWYVSGQYEKAAGLFHEALPILRHHDKNQNTLAICLKNLAWVHLEFARPDDADPCLDEALAIQHRLYGEEHPDIAETLSKVGVSQKARGYLPQAEATFHQALAMRRKFLGDKHMLVAWDMDNLGGIAWQQRRLDEAEQRFRESLAMRRELLGATHPDLARSCHYLGWLMIGRDNHEAEQLLREALAMRSEDYPQDHPYVAQNLYLLGMVLYRMDRIEEALPCLHKSYAIRAKQLPSHVPGVESPTASAGGKQVTWAGGVAMEPIDRISVAQLLRDCYVSLEQYGEAEPFAAEVYYGRSTLEGPDHKNTRRALERLVAIYESLNDRVKASGYRQLLGDD